VAGLQAEGPSQPNREEIKRQAAADPPAPSRRLPSTVRLASKAPGRLETNPYRNEGSEGHRENIP